MICTLGLGHCLRLGLGWTRARVRAGPGVRAYFVVVVIAMVKVVATAMVKVMVMWPHVVKVAVMVKVVVMGI